MLWGWTLFWKREVYLSFLIRMWRATPLQKEKPLWQCEVEHIQSGRRWRFGSLDELLSFLEKVENLTESD